MAIRGTEIKIQGLTHRYTPRSPVTFNRVDLVSPPGEALAIIGRSGCGKSTLLHILAGIHKPTEGRVLLDGTAITAPSPRWVMMFQAPHLFPWMTVSQNVGVGLSFGRWSKQETDDRVKQAIKLVELEAWADNNLQDLSGGQQQSPPASAPAGGAPPRHGEERRGPPPASRPGREGSAGRHSTVRGWRPCGPRGRAAGPARRASVAAPSRPLGEARPRWRRSTGPGSQA